MLFAFLQVTWRDIAGLDEVINELQDTVILPFQKRHLLAGSKLFQPPKGITAGHPNGIKLWRKKETDNQLFFSLGRAYIIHVHLLLSFK